MSSQLPSKKLLYGASNRVEEIRATIDDMRRSGLRGIVPQDEALYLLSEIDRLTGLINTPHTHDFIEAVRLEMPHQRVRWGAEHDAGKTPADWFWLVGYLAGKALHAIVSGNREKAKHHVITTAATLGNWFLAITGESTSMRPGIDPPKEVSNG